MSALLLKEKADYLVHDSYTVETEDHEDHTFNGVMFDVHTKFDRPVDCVIIDSIYVRGGLGQMSVWYARGGFSGREENGDEWLPCYSRRHEPSWREFDKLELEIPMIFEPGETYGIYVHSAEYGDDGVVYDNQRAELCHEDDFICVYPGLAHLSPEPFSGDGPWWGSPWRRRRQFVGKLSYGARYVLWRPQAHSAFSAPFQNGCAAAFFALCMGWRGLPSDCVLYILHMARFDWFDTPESIEHQRRLRAEALRADDDDDDEDGDFASEDDDDVVELELTPEEALAQQQRRYTSDYSRFDNILDSDDED